MGSRKLADVFREHVTDLKDDSGHININQLIDVILQEYDQFNDIPQNELIKKAIYPQVVSLLNKSEFYSLGKGDFISLDYANAEELQTFIDRSNDMLSSVISKVSRLKKRKEQQVQGQLTIVFDGIQFAGYQEMAI